MTDYVKKSNIIGYKFKGCDKTMMPKLFTMFKNKEITKNQVAKDIIAGIIVAVIALPLSIALAISSGVSPEKGLITAIFAGFLISFLGGSKVQIGGPTAAFVTIIYSIIAEHGLDGLITAVIMAGIILVIMGLLRFGSLIRYVPKTITVGFTAGIAVTLFSGQLKDLLGLQIDNVPAEFIPKWGSYFANMNTLNIYSLAIGIGCIVIIALWPKVNKVIPGSMIALIASTLLVQVLHLPVDTIGSRFTEISSAIPIPALPSFSIATINKLFAPAITIAILGALESLLSAVVADEMIDDTHDSNMELVAQGIANITSGLFGGIPATGAIARTAANIKSGGKSPISGMVHAITLLFTMLLLMPLAKMIPMTTLSAILIVVAYNMSGWRTFKELLRAPKSDIIVLLVTFGCTVIFDLVVAIGFGMIMTMALFMKRVTDTTEIRDLVYEKVFEGDITEMLEDAAGKINIYQVNGPIFFGVVQDFIHKTKELNQSMEVLILDMRHTHAIDASAVDAINKLLAQCSKLNIKLYLTHVNEQPARVLKRMGFTDRLGEENIYETKTKAIVDAYEYVQKLMA
ncbi:C4-dicarboxylic acid transporter DauA [Clostridium neonatale]|uniref:C4-dicarboxylic acid transporter DauA n=2 Tax=Clostridium neonatale TaxID=137838 RepID=A0A650MUL8_9CLOT|nr:C4-dicarboxylic acid transporter DauA [Clostridium neonatale]SUQ54168.1 C4-dicarboxylic acid transporter DauA [Clostridium neonatale]SUQ54679.1 C4-dicarboxylic acid transporter DauA [Clostridium neonatale]VCT86181.1 C4-dicarboxylic acid transporter DauA [Clostridium neonatale]